MTKNKGNLVYYIPVILILAVVIFLFMSRSTNHREDTVKVIAVAAGKVENLIITTGVVQPQNRLEVIPPIGGRIEAILVKEGERVTKGDTVAWMSSTERAALLDAARSQGEDSVKYWEEVYKSTPLIAPISGEVIVRSVEPGQTVSASKPVIVLSDRLIVQAQVDESDIGRVKVGQTAEVTLDAYPTETIKGLVDHISYESKTISNVTIYEVDILPRNVPLFYRSGMSANVHIIENRKENVLIVPLEALGEEAGEHFVFLHGSNGRASEKKKVRIGLKDDVHAQVLTGLKAGDAIVIKRQEKKQEFKEVKNPFMPFSYKKRK